MEKSAYTDHRLITALALARFENTVENKIYSLKFFTEMFLDGSECAKLSQNVQQIIRKKGVKAFWIKA